MVKGKTRMILTKSKGWGWLIGLFMIAAFGAQLPLEASVPKATCEVEYINDKLTINVDKVTLGRVLEEIREKTGIQFVLSQGLSEVPISVQLGPLSVVESLERMLSHSNHVFILGADQKLIKVVILDYSKLDSSARLREVAETPGVQGVILPSLAGAEDIKPATEEARAVMSAEDVPVMRSSEPMVTRPSTSEDMVVTPTFETMVVNPASAQMIVTPPTRAITSLVENMIIKVSPGVSSP